MNHENYQFTPFTVSSSNGENTLVYNSLLLYGKGKSGYTLKK